MGWPGNSLWTLELMVSEGQSQHDAAKQTSIGEKYPRPFYSVSCNYPIHAFSAHLSIEQSIKKKKEVWAPMNDSTKG